MTAYKQAVRNEIARRIARHAATHCANQNDFAAAALIAMLWGVSPWGAFVNLGW